jgi:hypothetical protein
MGWKDYKGAPGNFGGDGNFGVCNISPALCWRIKLRALHMLGKYATYEI